MALSLDLYSHIFSFLDRCTDKPLVFTFFPDFTSSERKKIDERWLAESRVDHHRGTIPHSLFSDTGEWCRNGEYHRDECDSLGISLPAFICGERKEWWINGARHRLDGPAVVNLEAYETAVEEWWVVNGEMTEGP